ncbi:MAG: glycosyltransferase [Bacteroidales bacterium]|nr:glycosyltransferase [Bacteroidales bacterium]
MTHKLLQINPVVRLNTSTGRIMKEIGEIAVAAGWESFIAYSGARDGVPQHSSQLVPVGNKLDLALHAVATRLFDAHGLASRRATKQLIRRIREIDPDVIHIHNVHGYWLNYPLLCRYLQESGKPVIWTVHDCWLYTGHCYYYSAARCDKWSTGCGHCPQKRAFPASWLFDRSARNWQDKRRAFGSIQRLTIVPVSDWIRREMSRSFLADKQFQVIHNGIDLDVFRPDANGETERPAGTVILGVATLWHEEKGVRDFVELAGKLRPDEQLVLVGRMSEAQRAAFPAGVQFIERTENVGKLAALYAGATAFVNPTWQDNYPTVNLEAIACGTPVVTYRTGGSVEAVTEGTGFVVEQGDVDGLLARVRELAAQDRQALAARCRTYALQHFSKQERYQDYIRLYENLAAR